VGGVTVPEARLRQLSDLLTQASIEGASGLCYYPMQLLGEGGQGWVYRAGYDEPDGPSVVVKILRPDVVNEEALTRFLREADVLRKLGQTQAPSPSVVRFYDHGICRYTMPDGETYALPFTVLEFVNGQTLAQLLAQTPYQGLAVPRVRRLFRQVARALSLIHGAQLIHRDLKPSNLLIASDGDQEVIKITDFGLVKRFDVDARGTLALAGASVGYAPPEQFEMGNRRVSARTDLFAFATVLFETLTGTPAFAFARGETPFQVLSRILSGPRPQLATHVGSLPPGLAERPDLVALIDHELDRATRSDPGERHESLLDFWGPVEAVLRQAVPGPPPQHARPVLSPNSPRAPEASHLPTPAAHPGSSVMPPPGSSGAPHPGSSGMPHPGLSGMPPAVHHPGGSVAPPGGASGAVPGGASTIHGYASPNAVVAPTASTASTPPTPGGSGEHAATREAMLSVSGVLPTPGAAGPGGGAPPPPSASPPPSFRFGSRAMLPDAAWAMTFSSDGRGAFALGRFGLLRHDGGAWSGNLLPAGLDPLQMRGVLAMPQGALVYGERGQLWGQGADGGFVPWTTPENNLIWLNAVLVPHPAEILLIGEHTDQQAAALGVLRPGQAITRRTIEGTQRLTAAARLVSGGLLVCGDGGELLHIGNGPPEPVAWGRTGHLAAILPTADGGAFVVGSGGHALRVTAGHEARLEPVQTTRDLLTLATTPAAVPWAGGQDARLLRRSAAGWIRIPLPSSLHASIRALHADATTLRVLLDDGQLLEGSFA
jgi:serine/threonine protein kinase